MKTNKYSDLIKFGLSPNTLMSLSESEINILHKNLISENGTKTAPTKPGTKTPPKTRPSHPGKTPKPGVNPPPKAKKETKEVVTKTSTTSTYDITNPADASAVNKELMAKGLNAEVNPTTRKLTLTNGEVKENNKKSKVNPWAVCHAQLGPKKTKKFERCVMGVKKSISEGKDPYSVLLENKILSLVEKYVKPKMKKGELMDLIGKKKMNFPIGKLGSIGVANEDTKTAPTKPGTKTPPKTRPSHPGKNPNPGVNPAPKAKNAEQVKDDMIGAIMNLLKK